AVFNEDLALEYSLQAGEGGSLEVLTHRDPSPTAPRLTARRPPLPQQPPGFLLASALLPPRRAETAGRGQIALTAHCDSSLSMQWDKLERNYRALETLLLGLQPEDRFNLLTFDVETRQFAQGLQPADTTVVEGALEWVRQSLIRGGTDLSRALSAGLAAAAG